MQQQWSAVDNFMISSLIPEDEVLSKVLEKQPAPTPRTRCCANQGNYWRCSCA